MVKLAVHASLSPSSSTVPSRVMVSIIASVDFSYRVNVTLAPFGAVSVPSAFAHFLVTVTVVTSGTWVLVRVVTPSSTSVLLSL